MNLCKTIPSQDELAGAERATTPKFQETINRLSTKEIGRRGRPGDDLATAWGRPGDDRGRSGTTGDGLGTAWGTAMKGGARATSSTGAAVAAGR
ncbi:MAG: hypothetical protein IPK72_20380 [Candidatus Eisenbacteria bacterium]|nr:hypothetical protein [Candidatus Eisenbacteria bacterium]